MLTRNIAPQPDAGGKFVVAFQRTYMNGTYYVSEARVQQVTGGVTDLNYYIPWESTISDHSLGLIPRQSRLCIMP